MEGISADSLRDNVRRLADDAFEGRETGSGGGTRAAQFLVNRLRQFGVRPAAGKSYFQPVRFVKPRLDPARSFLSIRRGDKSLTLQHGKEFLLNGGHPISAHRSGELVFAGYGITAPEYEYDDYRDLPVKGKIVVLLAGQPSRPEQPDFFHGGHDPKYDSGAARIERARSLGAAAVITIATGERALRIRWDLLTRVQSHGSVALASKIADAFPALVVRKAGAEQLFAGAERDWDAIEQEIATGKVLPEPLTGEAELRLESDEFPFQAPNVAGMVEGSDPLLKEQYVVFSAHYDHLGRKDGDQIFDGAWDNASGTAEVLEIARACAAMKPAPRRSILFVFFTGEEEGLLGSRFYTQHPLVPLARTAADINLDMTEIFGVPKELVAQGAEHSTLQSDAEKTAAELGLKIGKDPTPKLGVFTRSDQFSFAQAGVPCVFIRWANEYEDLSPQEAQERANDKLGKIYHQTADRFDPTWSWEGMRKNAQSAMLLGLHVADDDDLPSWKPGDPFNRPRSAPAGS